MKYIIYCRKSSEQEDRQALSIDSQQKELVQITKQLNLNMVETLHESKSAKLPGKRDQFNHLIEQIENGSANAILVWHPDRLSRNPQDSARIVSLIDSGHLLEVRTPTNVYDNDPTNKFMLGFLMIQAKLENDNKGVNVKRGLKAKAEKGWLPSGAKAGYKNDKYAEKGDKKLHPDSKRFPLIKKCWELLLSRAYTVAEILDKLNNEWGYRTPKHKRIGGKPMQRSQIYRMFKDTFYYGDFEYPEKSGKWYSGKHKPMISKEEFDRVQIILGNKNCRRPQKRSFIYTGIIRCGECSAMVTAEEKWQTICSNCKNKFSSQHKDYCPKCSTKITAMKDPKILHYIYYHCTKRKNPNCTQGSVAPSDIEKQIDSLLGSLQISPEFTKWAIKHLNELNNQEGEHRVATQESLTDTHKDYTKRIDRLLSLYISPQNASGELLSEQEFKSQKQSLMREKTSLEEKMSDSNQNFDQWVESAENVFNFARNARHNFANGDKEVKRQIFVSLGSNITLKDKIVRVELEKPLELIQSAVQEDYIISPAFEPKEYDYTSVQMSSVFAQNPTLLPGLDSNQ